VFAPLFIGHQWVFVHPTIGQFPNLIQVPTHFFKVVVATARDKGGETRVAVAAFLVPNSNSVGEKEPLCNYLVRLDQLESIGQTSPTHYTTYTSSFIFVDAFLLDYYSYWYIFFKCLNSP
jgi:DNA/RNA endonuclease G (NUC1)